ncbi:hypothetical protein PG913_03205 [Tenacibaculum pacificus]|uniref:hypothetical protein n=1 Tax=Tenacibaculum pacificus TaxID=3018314 RepID=UPI0022F39EF4|nr:hypothetical protein [Tenacibaculum pacificus]WBX74237.1 hypothetical protein PG913_03205 [Tenacibaculum pacificus]
MENYTVKEGKTNAIISHFLIIGTIIALVLNKDKNNSFTSFHIRQMIGLNALLLLDSFILSNYIGLFGGIVIRIFLFVLWLISFMGALKGEEKKYLF